jgi:F-type H+-transporting ATPase subunit b
MKNFCFALCLALILFFDINLASSAESGMPQLDTEFWTAQIFWLILIFSSLYLIIWKIFLPKITNNIENRKLRVINDLDETEKFKENTQKKLDEYNKIIETTKKEAKKIVENNKKKLEQNINSKKQKFNEEIENELIAVEKEIESLKKTSISNINKIAVEISSEIIKLILGTEVNKSNVSAIVEDVTKKEAQRL